MGGPVVQLKEQDGNPSGLTPPAAGVAIWGDSQSNYGIYGSSGGSNGVDVGTTGIGVFGQNNAGGEGVRGMSTGTGGTGVVGESDSGRGIYAQTAGTSLPALEAQYIGPGGTSAIYADGHNGDGVRGHSNTGFGVSGISEGSTGVYGQSNLAGFLIIDGGITPGGIGVQGVNNLDYSTGVSGIANGTLSTGVSGSTSGNGPGVSGSSQSGTGVSGSSQSGTGVSGGGGYGVRGYGGDIGVYAQNSTTSGNIVYLATRALAGDFYGQVTFHQQINKRGGGFQIDHPLDPAKKYLSHSFVESPDMKNIYDGVAVLDANGEAGVELPVWFEALNTDFRYQLTCIGGYAPVYIAQEVRGNRFKIAGGTPGMRISWQVTGSRQDAWANAHRIQVEIEKPVEEQGYYLDPELHGESEEKSVRWARYPKQE